MPQSSWNPNTPDVIGVEFQGCGIASHIIQTNSKMRALRFKPQRTGEVDQIAVYSGAGTNSPILPTIFAGHRQPFLVELIPVSGFDPGGLHTITRYPGTITTSTNVVDETLTAPEGNELAAANDGLVLFTSGPGGTATVHFPLANTFPLDRHVISVAVEYDISHSDRVRRIDQSGSTLWNRILPAGTKNWHMAETYIEAGQTTEWRLWSPNDVRQFTSGTGNRRLKIDATSNTVTHTWDWLGIHVDHIPERRAGVAVIEPTGTWQWVTGNMHLPNVTGAPAVVQQGADYVVLIRTPAGGDTDFGTTSKFDLRALADRRPNGDFQHYTYLDWDLHDVVVWEGGVPRALGAQVDGLLALRIINDNQQTVDTQPYSAAASSGVIPQIENNVTDRAKQTVEVPAGSAEYSKLRVSVGRIGPQPTNPIVPEPIEVTLRQFNDENVIAGPFMITDAAWQASPNLGTDFFGDQYREVTLEFGSGIDLATGPLDIHFVLSDSYIGNNVWRIGCLYSDLAPVTGSDQTAIVSGTGEAFIPPSNVLRNINTANVSRGDLEVVLLSQAPEITGIGVTGMSQPITGHAGVCDPCPEPGTSLLLPGAGGANSSTPDLATFTDLDVRIELSMNDWTPGGFGQRIIDQDGGSGNFSWGLGLNPSGILVLSISSNGTATVDRPASISLGFIDGTNHWLRFTFDADDGAGNHDVTYYTSEDGETWTQLGAVVQTAGTFTLFNSSAPIRVGGAVLEAAGRVRSAQIRSIIDGPMLVNPIFTEQLIGTRSFVDALGRTWTINGTASIAFDTNVPVPIACAVEGIPFNRICWTPSTLASEDFGYYEVQRFEHGHGEGEWQTIAILSPDEPLESLNVLTPEQASCTVTLQQFSVISGSNRVIVGTPVLEGTTSLEFNRTLVDSGTAEALTLGVNSGGMVLTHTLPERQYTAIASFRASVTGRDCRVVLEFRDQFDTLITSLTGPTIMNNTSGWVQASVTGTSPAGTAIARLRVQALNAPDNEQHFADALSVHEGTSLTWRPGKEFGPLSASMAGVFTNCYDDWSMPYDTEVCYRVRQQRGTDGTLSDFIEEACIETMSPEGADLIITAPEDPSLNVAFPEAHSGQLPIQRTWQILDADEHVLRAVYGRDGHLAFRPLEELGIAFQRQVLVSGLCTPTMPSHDVVMRIHEICQATVSSLVVRDREGNRWYASVNVPSYTQIHDPVLGDLWIADVRVNELATPILDAEHPGVI